MIVVGRHRYGPSCTNPDDIDKGVRLPCQVGSFVYAFLLGFNTTAYAVGKEPKSWAEFWDIKASPGTRTLADMASGSCRRSVAGIGSATIWIAAWRD
jgi:putative spermidine/putrescine transport system substrate-binding protein